MMRNNIFRALALSMAIVLMALSAASCGVDYTDDEIKAVAEELIEGSFEINEIYFGKGLPISEEDSEAAKKFAAENGFDLENIQFLPVTDDSEYTSIDSIKKATAKIYSDGYCEYLYSMAFEGYSTEEGDAVFAKYIEDNKGVLTVRIDLAENELPARTYDFSTMTVKSQKSDSVMVELDSYLDGEKEEGRVSFSLVKEEDGWRLDTPTY